MMIVVLQISKATARQAERLLDLMYWQNNQKHIGECLLMFAPDVHKEDQKKLTLSAELAFHVERATGSGFRDAAEAVQKMYRVPWLFLESDCVPLRAGWLDALYDAYLHQPKLCMGPILMKQNGERFLGRVSVYPPDVAQYAVLSFLPMSCQTKMIQELRYSGDESTIRRDAVLLHGDPSGLLVEQLMDKSTPEPSEKPAVVEAPMPGESTASEPEPEPKTPALPQKRKPGRPPKLKPN